MIIKQIKDEHGNEYILGFEEGITEFTIENSIWAKTTEVMTEEEWVRQYVDILLNHE